MHRHWKAKCFVDCQSYCFRLCKLRRIQLYKHLSQWYYLFFCRWYQLKNNPVEFPNSAIWAKDGCFINKIVRERTPAMIYFVHTNPCCIVASRIFFKHVFSFFKFKLHVCEISCLQNVASNPWNGVTEITHNVRYIQLLNNGTYSDKYDVTAQCSLQKIIQNLTAFEWKMPT